MTGIGSRVTSTPAKILALSEKPGSSIGHRTRFHAVGFSPDRFAHVYPETLLGREWVPLETTEPWEAGRAPERAAVHMIVHV